MKLKDKLKGILKGVNKPKKLLIIAALALAVLFIGWKAVIFNIPRRQTVAVTQSTLEEMIHISQLTTSKTEYQSFVTVYTDDKKLQVKYYASYTGIVGSGIDFDKVQVAVDRENKVVTLGLPEMFTSIESLKVEDYIFSSQKYDIGIVSAEAYGRCMEDLNEKIESNLELDEIAKKNTESAVKGLIEPWLLRVDSEYKVEVVWGDLLV